MARHAAQLRFHFGGAHRGNEIRVERFGDDVRPPARLNLRLELADRGLEFAVAGVEATRQGRAGFRCGIAAPGLMRSCSFSAHGPKHSDLPRLEPVFGGGLAFAADKLAQWGKQEESPGLSESRPKDFDPKYMSSHEYRSSGRAVKPKDAATLILVRQDADEPRILLGKRHASHKFMPNKFVFPGGRVDVGDGRVAPHTDLKPQVLERLAQGCSETKARALAMAAIRETFEEAGLLLGQKSSAPPRTRSPHWRAFFDHGVVPTLDKLHFVARAITPPYRTRRFDTRFFLTDASHIQGDLHDTSKGSGELLELCWFTPREAQEIELPNITRMVLSEVERRLARPLSYSEPGPFVYFRNGQPVRDKT